MLNILSKNFVCGSYSVRTVKIPNIDIKIDLNKHYPVFKLFDFSNIMTNEHIIKYSNSRVNCIINNSTYAHKDYNKDHIKAFLNSERSISINCSYGYGNIKYIIADLDNIMFSLHVVNSTYISTYTVGTGAEFLYLLCVKQEYIYYLKLCILTNTEPEFDCFYILAVNNGYQKCNYLYIKKIHNAITKAIKKYRIPVIFVDSIEKEITKTIKLPKFNTIKDYNQWLESIKIGFFNDVSNNKLLQEEELPF